METTSTTPPETCETTKVECGECGSKKDKRKRNGYKPIKRKNCEFL